MAATGRSAQTAPGTRSVGRWHATRVTDRADGRELVWSGQGLSVRGMVTAARKDLVSGVLPTRWQPPRHRQLLDGDDLGDSAAPPAPTPAA